MAIKITYLEPRWVNVIMLDGKHYVCQARHKTRALAAKQKGPSKVLYRLRIRYKNFVVEDVNTGKNIFSHKCG